jgi:hypothetical protein
VKNAKEVWAVLNRSITPSNKPVKRTEHAFISFKRNPDEPIARTLASDLAFQQLRVVKLHGEAECPFKESEKAQAITWIRGHLDACIGKSQALVVIATAASMKSQWVYHEYSVATLTANVVFLLWFDGEDPTKYFIPPPTWLMRRGPSCPVYLLDLRTEREKGVRELGVALEELPRSRKRRMRAFLKSMLWFVPLVFLFFGFIAITVGSRSQIESESASERSKAAERAKAMATLSLAALVAIGAVFFPWTYRLTKEQANTGKFKRLVNGFSINRYGVLFTALVARGALGAVIMGLGFLFIFMGVRRFLTWRVTRRLDQRGIPLGLEN